MRCDKRGTEPCSVRRKRSNSSRGKELSRCSGTSSERHNRGSGPQRPSKHALGTRTVETPSRDADPQGAASLSPARSRRSATARRLKDLPCGRYALSPTDNSRRHDACARSLSRKWLGTRRSESGGQPTVSLRGRVWRRALLWSAWMQHGHHDSGNSHRGASADAQRNGLFVLIYSSDRGSSVNAA